MILVINLWPLLGLFASAMICDDEIEIFVRKARNVSSLFFPLPLLPVAHLISLLIIVRRPRDEEVATHALGKSLRNQSL